MARAKRRLGTPMRLALLCVFGILVFALTIVQHWSERHAVMINATHSLPYWAFFVTSGTFPERGEIVIFDPGRDPLTLATFGKKPQPFAKIAYGLPGDVVSREDDEVRVNGQRVASLKTLTRKGEKLSAGPIGIVPQGCVFAATPHKDGFDSRYAAIGFVCRDRLVGTGKPIL